MIVVRMGLALTVKVIEVVGIREPDVPLITMVLEPTVANEVAVKVTVLVLVAGFVPNVAVTPLGRPESTDKVTLLLKPPDGVMVIVLELLVVPWLTLKVAGDAARVKLGATATVTGTLPLTPP